MENKDMPAFPTITWDQLENGQVIQMTEHSGVSKFELFACNAPNEIPGWFKHIEPEKNISECPDYNNIENKEDKEFCRQWLNDTEFELPEHLKWFIDKTEKSRIEYFDWLRSDKEARYFQWRRYYAEQLLATLSKPQP